MGHMAVEPTRGPPVILLSILLVFWDVKSPSVSDESERVTYCG